MENIIIAQTELEKTIDDIQLASKKRVLRAELLDSDSLTKMQCVGFFAGNSATSFVASIDVSKFMFVIYLV